MYIRSRTSKDYRYYAVVTAERCANKVKQKNVRNIGRLDNLSSDELLEKIAIVDSLDSEKISREFRELLFTLNYSIHDLIRIKKSLHYGDVAILARIAEMLDIPEIISRHSAKGGGPDAGKIITIMAICQALAPTSKNDLRNWYEETALYYIIGIKSEDVEEWILYSCMRHLTEGRIERIEADIVNILVKKFKIELDTWLYDLTSIYFYARMDDQKKKGYSRDHMRHLVQLVLALAVTKEHGLPIKHWVYPGNTTDVTTLPTAAKNLKELYEEHKITLVFDRGNLSEKNVKTLDAMDYDYVCGLKRGIKAVKELIESAKEDAKFELVKVLENGEHYQFIYGTSLETELWGKKRKVIICFSEELQATKRETRSRKLEKALKALEKLELKAESRRYSHDDLNIKIHECIKGVKRYFDKTIVDHPAGAELSFEKQESAAGVDGRKIRWIDQRLCRLQASAVQMTADDVRKEVKKILGKHKKHYHYRVRDVRACSTFTYKLLRDVIEEKSNLDGFYALMSTDCSISMEAIIETYDSRDVVEKCFATLKHPVKIRPIRHWVPQMVRAHVYICVLGYLLRQMLVFLLDREGLDLCLRDVLISLRRLKVIQFSSDPENIDLRFTELTSTQKKLLDLVGLPHAPPKCG